jgi:hypothetical protein
MNTRLLHRILSGMRGRDEGSGNRAILKVLLMAVCCVVGASFALGQNERGEIRLRVVDSSGAPLAAHGSLEGASQQVHRVVRTTEGFYDAPGLLYGEYTLHIAAPGFAPISQVVQVASPLPVRLEMILRVASTTQNLHVSASGGLLDPEQAGSASYISQSQLAHQIPAQPGRGLLDAIDEQAGWLFEANGVLHPRGSEYDVQFVIDGMPRTENLSPAFGSALLGGEVETAQVRTAGFPAEYGRSLGAVIDVTTRRDIDRGWHGEAVAYGGSFAMKGGQGLLSYGSRHQEIALSGEGFGTDRYLDPPVLNDYTNHATEENTRADEQWSPRESDRLSFDFAQSSLRAMVPNETVQERAGQRQQRRGRQYSGEGAWQHIVSPDLLYSVAGSLVDTTASLESNPQSTPVVVGQDRGFGEGYVRADVAGHAGHQDWKAGGDAILRRVHESLNYEITDPTQFEPGTQLAFQFADARWDSEPAAYVEDAVRIGPWNADVGLRYDQYDFVVYKSAWSPRIAVSRYIAKRAMTVHASYDRVFQVPAVENLLLASSPRLDSISSFVKRLPVRPARADYYEAGAAKAFAGHVLLTANLFERIFRNYPDDDQLLNTGISFPISDASATIRGEEVSLEMPDWRGITAHLSYSNQTGIAAGPVTGGLFIGDEGAGELASNGTFAISQDQRNTARADFRWSFHPRLWAAAREEYNSGLPVDLPEAVTTASLVESYGSSVVSQINLKRGRVRPSSSTDLSMGWEIYQDGSRNTALEFAGTNITNRLNVIDFASLFSGTAIGVPRSYDARLTLSF